MDNVDNTLSILNSFLVVLYVKTSIKLINNKMYFKISNLWKNEEKKTFQFSSLSTQLFSAKKKKISIPRQFNSYQHWSSSPFPSSRDLWHSKSTKSVVDLPQGVLSIRGRWLYRVACDLGDSSAFGIQRSTDSLIWRSAKRASQWERERYSFTGVRIFHF